MDIVVMMLTGLEVIVALLLIFIILIQRSKAGGGLGGLATTSSGVEEAFGSSAGNVLTKVTVWLALTFLVNTLLIGIIEKNRAGGGRDIMKDAVEEPADPETPRETTEEAEDREDDVGATDDSIGDLAPESPEGTPIADPDEATPPPAEDTSERPTE